MERADERTVGAGWKGGPGIRGIAWPPELLAGSKIEDEETIPHPTGNVRPKGWGPSKISR